MEAKLKNVQIVINDWKRHVNSFIRGNIEECSTPKTSGVLLYKKL